MKVTVSEMTKKYKAVLATSGASQADIDAMTTLYLEQDLHNNYFSGLWEVEGVLRGIEKINWQTACSRGE